MELVADARTYGVSYRYYSTTYYVKVAVESSFYLIALPFSRLHVIASRLVG